MRYEIAEELDGILATQGNQQVSVCGGSRFIHGGAMLQEIVVPLITVIEQKGMAKARSELISLSQETFRTWF